MAGALDAKRAGGGEGGGVSFSFKHRGPGKTAADVCPTSFLPSGGLPTGVGSPEAHDGFSGDGMPTYTT